MKIFILVFALVTIIRVISSQNLNNLNAIPPLIKALEEAENSKYIKFVNNAFSENATLLYPGGLPVLWKED